MHVSLQDPNYKSYVQLTVVRNETKEKVRYTYTGEVPKQLMDAYQQVVGNGQARVSVSTEVGAKEFGTGASSMVTVSLSCNQDQQTLLTAINLAGEMARWAAKDLLGKSETELQQMLAAKGGNQGSPHYG